VAYTLLDLKRLGIGVRELVCRLERGVIAMLADYGIEANGREGAPGVYCGDAKIASIGLRVRRNCSYHGLAVNVMPELEPFGRINPCGYEGLSVTSIEALGGPADMEAARAGLQASLCRQLGLQPEN